jgi:hypothetical protein
LQPLSQRAAEAFCRLRVHVAEHVPEVFVGVVGIQVSSDAEAAVALFVGGQIGVELLP